MSDSFVFRKGATRLLLAIVAASASLIAPVTYAQGYPNRPIRLIVPFGPGGSNDIVGRIVGQKLSEQLGQPVVVENRAGAGGMIGTDFVVNAPPDGYTLAIGGTSTIAANVGLYPKRAFDPLKALIPIMEIGVSPFLMAVPASSPVKNVHDFVELAKANPGTLNFGSSGKGSSMHLTGEMLKSQAKINIEHVPYKSGGAAVTDLAAGRVQLVYSDLPALLPFIQSGQIRALAVTTPKRSPLLPNLPTMSEAGVPEFDATSWYGIFGPTGMPPDVLAKLRSALTQITSSADLKEKFNQLGIEPMSGATAPFSAYIKTEVDRWSKVVKTSGAELE